MKVNEKYLSFYYAGLKEIPDIELDLEKTALLVVDLQNEFVREDMGEAKEFKDAGDWDRWVPYFTRLNQVVVPNTKKLLDYFRENKMYVTYGRIACLLSNGADRSTVQQGEGWNSMLIPIDSENAAMVEPLTPMKDEIVVNKTTDSVVNGTNYAFLLKNMGVETIVVTGIVTDQCVASTVRDLADAGFKVIVVEDCCASADMELHHAELRIMNIIYCNVVSSDEIIDIMEKAKKK